MFATVILLLAVFWLVLAVAVGFHARGHNRSGIIWFGVVAVTGIFGVVFYLLFITSASENRSDTDNRSLDRKIPLYAFCAVFGSVIATLVSYSWGKMAEIVTLATMSGKEMVAGPARIVAVLVVFVSLLGGAVAGPILVRKYSLRKLGYLVSYVPSMMVGMLGALFLLRSVHNFSGVGFPYLYSLTAESIGAIIGAVIWNRVYGTVVGPSIRSFLYTEDETSSVSLSRRRVLGLTGVATGIGTSLAIGGRVYGFLGPELRIVSTERRYSSGDPVVIVKMENPRTEPVTVDIRVEIKGVLGEKHAEETETATISSGSTDLESIPFFGTDIGENFRVENATFEEVE